MRTHAHTHALINKYADIQTDMQKSNGSSSAICVMHTCMHAYMRTCVHVYMRTHIHAHMKEREREREKEREIERERWNTKRESLIGH